MHIQPGHDPSPSHHQHAHVLTHFLPLVYPSHHFAKNPPWSRCSFQLALRPAILGSRLSLFCEFRLANSPRSPEALLERRRSLTVGGEPLPLPLLLLVVVLLLLLEEVVEVLEPWVSC